jgi:hypothetical protein
VECCQSLVAIMLCVPTKVHVTGSGRPMVWKLVIFRVAVHGVYCHFGEYESLLCHVES